jgi:lipid A ethanolaminephosphotransferase
MRLLRHVRRLRDRPVPLPALNLAVALFLVAVSNVPFWRTVLQASGGLTWHNAAFLASTVVVVALMLNLLLTAITWGRLAKPVLGIVLIASAIVTYYMQAYGVVFDRSMIANVVETHREEVFELMSVDLFAWVALLGVLPAALVARTRLATAGSRWRRAVATGSVATVTALGVVVISALFYQQYAGLLRNHKELRFLLVPTNYLSAAYGYAVRRFAPPSQLQIVGEDAKRAAPVQGRRKPTLTVLVVGETARAGQFSLNGYGRPTNPELAREDVISYTDAVSCGTATAVSLPCMFLDVGRDLYRDRMARSREGLLDVLQRAGVEVLWRENNSGCKGACDRVPHEDLSHARIDELCPAECYDDILLHGLQDRIDDLRGDAVLVLHMKGSHGPAYYLRYPPRFEVFKPACKTAELGNCKREEVVNAYDNSILYTDHVLTEAIRLLQRNARRFDTALLYVSDHGESLGENGVYLHGLPYVLAPREQTHIPMVLWLSKGMREHAGLDAHCLRFNADRPYSHDNLFHSVLGLLDVETSAYIPGKDLFRACRNGAGAKKIAGRSAVRES